MLKNCSIVILAYNGSQFTRHCFENLLKAEDKPGQLFVVNNAATDNTAEVIAEFAPQFEEAGIDFVTWTNKENKGCSLARNEAWEKADGKYVLFMDNDTAVRTSRYLTRFVDIMDAHSDLALLGPKLLYPYVPHPIQCAGVGINPLGRIWFRGRGRPADEERFNVFTEVPALISACWIMRNNLRDEIGMLDELFHPVQYEDLDLCLRALKAGYRVGYTPEVEVYHFEGITTESFGREEYRKNIARNSIKFRRRYSSYLKEIGSEIAEDDLKWLSKDAMGLRPELDLQIV